MNRPHCNPGHAGYTLQLAVIVTSTNIIGSAHTGLQQDGSHRVTLGYSRTGHIGLHWVTAGRLTPGFTGLQQDGLQQEAQGHVLSQRASTDGG
jgi:hypothetical protein